MEEAADRVTALYPGGTVRSEDTITVYVNPVTMPTMTGVETTVADQIKRKNPAVDPDPETGQSRVAAKTIAHRCVKLAVLAKLISAQCGSLPIFVTGYDAVVPAGNDQAAIRNHASWFMLHRRTDRSHVSWYDSKDGCRPSDRDAFEATLGYRGQCHEYPFWSTHQAWSGLLNDAQPRIVMSPPDQNSKVQGQALQQFYGTPRGFPFRPCNIPPTPDTTLTAIPAALRMFIGTQAATQAGSAFLNVPIGAAGGRVRTVGVCNDRPA